MHKIINWIHQIKDWTLAWALTPHAMIALFIISFAESSFFPIPPDILLIAMCISTPSKALLFALICTIGSSLGGMFGYYIGIKGGKPILKKFVKEEKIKEIHQYFEKYEEWAIGIAGFTPIPYKVFSISAGVFYVSFWKFVIISFLSRGARFFIVATAIMIFGEKIKAIIDKYFDILSIALVLLIVGGFFIMRKIKIPSKDKQNSNQDKSIKKELSTPPVEIAKN